MPLPLEGLQVVELATVLAGPAVGTFLAEQGATVIKIEPPSGDVTRSWKSASEPAGNSSAYYASVNWGKQVEYRNLKLEEDRRAVLELIRMADVVISNFLPDTARKLGMDFETLCTVNPGVILAELRGFEHRPERPAYDMVIQAETGWMDLNGEAGRGGVKMPVALVDVLAAHQLKEAVLLALLQRKKGIPQRISLSLEQASVSALANQAGNWLMNGELPRPQGNEHPNIAPYGEVLTTSDGQRLALAVGTNGQFAALCKILDRPELADDPRFSNNPQRVKNRRILLDLLAEKAVLQPGESLYNRCLEDGVPVGRINNLSEVFELPAARSLVLTDELGQRVKQTAFTLS